MDKTKWEHRIFESCIKKPRKTKQLTAADYKAEGKLPIVSQDSNTIASLTIPLPPLSLQQSFADKIAKIEDEKQRVKFSLKDLETLLASRMQYWFD